MRRREVITLLGGAAAAWPVAARAQQARETVRRIGVLLGLAENDVEGRGRLMALQRRLAELGWTEGRNIRIEYRWAAGDLDRVRDFAKELIALQPDLVVAHTTPVVLALLRETRTIPIVFLTVNEPIEQGIVRSLSHPGGNATGFTNLELTVGAKWLQLLKELAPAIRRVAVMFNPEATPVSAKFFRAVEDAGAGFAVDVALTAVHQSADIEAAAVKLAGTSEFGLIVPPDVFMTARRQLIVELAARHRLPAIYANRVFTAAGGLASYAIDAPDQFRQAAVYVDRILRGEKTTDLPVQQPNKFEFVINLKTAKALGLAISPMLLAAADEVTE